MNNLGLICERRAAVLRETWNELTPLGFSMDKFTSAFIAAHNNATWRGMMVAFIPPPACHKDDQKREAECLSALRPRFDEVAGPDEDYIGLIREGMEAGWSMKEVRLAVDALIGERLRENFRDTE